MVDFHGAWPPARVDEPVSLAWPSASARCLRRALSRRLRHRTGFAIHAPGPTSGRMGTTSPTRRSTRGSLEGCGDALVRFFRGRPRMMRAVLAAGIAVGLSGHAHGRDDQDVPTAQCVTIASRPSPASLRPPGTSAPDAAADRARARRGRSRPGRHRRGRAAPARRLADGRPRSLHRVRVSRDAHRHRREDHGPVVERTRIRVPKRPAIPSCSTTWRGARPARSRFSANLRWPASWRT